MSNYAHSAVRALPVRCCGLSPLFVNGHAIRRLSAMQRMKTAAHSSPHSGQPTQREGTGAKRGDQSQADRSRQFARRGRCCFARYDHPRRTAAWRADSGSGTILRSLGYRARRCAKRCAYWHRRAWSSRCPAGRHHHRPEEFSMKFRGCFSRSAQSNTVSAQMACINFTDAEIENVVKLHKRLVQLHAEGRGRRTISAPIRPFIKRSSKGPATNFWPNCTIR